MGFSSFEPVDCGCSAGGRPHPGGQNDLFSDNALFCLLILAILLFGFYFVIRAGVKNGILEVLRDPDCKLSGFLGG